MSKKLALQSILLGTLCSCGILTKTVTQDNTAPVPVPENTPSAIPKNIGLQIVAADSLSCPNGGSRILSFYDDNKNGILDSDESILSEANICNGLNGQNGQDGQDGQNGIGVGILVESASLASCTNGGSLFKTFSDLNNNSLFDLGESILSVSTICNGVNGQNGQDGQDGQNGQNGQDGQDGQNGADGQDGKSAHLSVTLATNTQCLNGGFVFTSYVDGQLSPDVSVVCNGLNGQDGQDGQDGQNGQDGQDGQNGQNGQDGQNGSSYFIGAVGAAVPGKDYSACHYDYLYFPNSNDPTRGWLTFRHQGNGTLDQGVGNSGYQVRNYDIPNFSLKAQTGNKTYCNLSWNASTRTLNYTVVDTDDGLQGSSGTINF